MFSYNFQQNKCDMQYWCSNNPPKEKHDNIMWISYWCKKTSTVTSIMTHLKSIKRLLMQEERKNKNKVENQES